MNVWILMVTMKSVPKVLVEVQQAAQSRKSSSTDQGDLGKFWNHGRKKHVGGLLVTRRTPRQAAGKCRQTIPASEAGWRDLWQELWQRCPGQFSMFNHAPSLLPWRCWCLQPGAGQWWHHRGQPRRESDVQFWSTKVEGPKIQTKELRNMCVIFVRDIGEYPVETEGKWYK